MKSHQKRIALALVLLACRPSYAQENAASKADAVDMMALCQESEKKVGQHWDKYADESLNIFRRFEAEKKKLHDERFEALSLKLSELPAADQTALLSHAKLARELKDIEKRASSDIKLTPPKGTYDRAPTQLDLVRDVQERMIKLSQIDVRNALGKVGVPSKPEDKVELAVLFSSTGDVFL